MPIPLALGLRALLAAGEPILAAGGRLAGAIGRRVAADPLTGAAMKAAAPVIETVAPVARAGVAAAGEGAATVANAGRQFMGGLTGATDAMPVGGLPNAAGNAVRGVGRNMAEGVRQVGKWADENPVKAGALQVASALPLISRALKDSKNTAASVEFQNLDPETQKHVWATNIVGARDYDHYYDLVKQSGIPDPMRLSEREFKTLRGNPLLLEQLQQQVGQ